MPRAEPGLHGFVAIHVLLSSASGPPPPCHPLSSCTGHDPPSGQDVASQLIRDWQLRKEGGTLSPEMDEALTADTSHPDTLVTGLDAVEASRPDTINAGPRMGTQWPEKLGAWLPFARFCVVSWEVELGGGAGRGICPHHGCAVPCDLVGSYPP